MSLAEGVIKFDLQHTPAGEIAATELPALIRVRQRLYRLGLIGQDPARYDGFGYGNLSCRHGSGFLISGTQTGGLQRLGPGHFTRVDSWDLAHNRLNSQGPIKPSSESLSHAALYQADAAIGAVLHLHWPALWQQAAALKLPTTAAAVPYGTPAMATALEELQRQTNAASGLLVMGGHLDGVVSYGPDLDAALAVILEWKTKLKLSTGS